MRQSPNILPSEVIVNEAIAVDSFTICNEFQIHFISAGSKIANTLCPFPEDPPFGFSSLPSLIDVSLCLKNIVMDELRYSMYAMNNSLSGSDLMSVKFL